MQPIAITPDDRSAAIANNILSIILTAQSQIVRLRADQPATDTQQVKNPAGVVIRTIPPLPAVTRAEIEARLGTANVATLDAVATALAGTTP